MKHFSNVKSSAIQIKQLEVNVDTVYIRTNIQSIGTEDFTGWQYDETQYSLREYMAILAQQEDIVQLRKEKEQLELEMARNSAEMFEAMIMLTGGM